MSPLKKSSSYSRHLFL